MKGYIKQTLFIAIFGIIAFFASASSADAFSINLGFGAYNYNGFGNYGYNVPVNCYVAGPGCNTGYGYYGNNYNTNYGNGYGNYGYGYNDYSSACFYNCYVAPAQNYYTGAYYESYPTYNYGYNYSNRNMYSSYNNYSYWYGY